MRTILTLAAAAGLLAACNNPEGANNNIRQLEGLYKKSYDLKDVPTAITAVQLILTQDSTHYLRDSLPSMYLVMQNVEACLATTEDALKRRPDDEELLKYKLLCLEEQGEEEKMMSLAAGLYEKTGRAEYLYKIASYHLVTKKFDEAAKTISEMETRFKDSRDSIPMPVGQGMTQKVPIQAATSYVKAYLSIQKGQYQQAVGLYQNAIRTYPDFVMAQRDLQQLLQGLQQQGGRR